MSQQSVGYRRVFSEKRVALGLVLLLAGLSLPVLAAADGAPLLPPFESEATERKHAWVQLKSGEWLKGEITRMFDDKLYFDSDEFDNVSLDWGDVAASSRRDP